MKELHSIFIIMKSIFLVFCPLYRLAFRDSFWKKPHGRSAGFCATAGRCGMQSPHRIHLVVGFSLTYNTSLPIVPSEDKVLIKQSRFECYANQDISPWTQIRVLPLQCYRRKWGPRSNLHIAQISTPSQRYPRILAKGFVPMGGWQSWPQRAST